MGLNIVQLRQMIRDTTGETITELPDDEADLYLNRAFWEIQDKFPFREKEKTVTFETQIGIRNYDVPTPFEAVTHLAIVDEFGQHKPLDRWDPDDYERNFIETTDEYGYPEKYTREGCFIRVWPTPNDIWTMVMRRLIILNDLSNTNSVPEIPQVWHEIIGWGGSWRRLLAPIGDHNRAYSIKSLCDKLIAEITPTEAKEEQANQQYAGLYSPYYRDTYDF